MTKINSFTQKTTAFFNTATHFLLKFQVLEKLEQQLSILKNIQRRFKKGKVLQTNRWFKFKPIAKFLLKRRPKKRVARHCIQSKLDLINQKVLVTIQLLLNNVPPNEIHIKSKYGFSAFLKMRSHGYRGKLIFLKGIGEDAVGKLLEEAKREGIDYVCPRTLGHFDGTNFTKKSDIVNAERAKERAKERAREAEYSLIETAKTSDEDALVDDYSSSYSFSDHWRFNNH